MSPLALSNPAISSAGLGLRPSSSLPVAPIHQSSSPYLASSGSFGTGQDPNDISILARKFGEYLRFRLRMSPAPSLVTMPPKSCLPTYTNPHIFEGIYTQGIVGVSGTPLNTGLEFLTHREIYARDVVPLKGEGQFESIYLSYWTQGNTGQQIVASIENQNGIDAILPLTNGPRTYELSVKRVGQPTDTYIVHSELDSKCALGAYPTHFVESNQKIFKDVVKTIKPSKGSASRALRKIDAIFRYVARSIVFSLDKSNPYLYSTAQELLEVISKGEIPRGKCKHYARLHAGLLRAAGFQAIVGHSPGHAFVVVLLREHHGMQITKDATPIPIAPNQVISGTRLVNPDGTPVLGVTVRISDPSIQSALPDGKVSSLMTPKEFRRFHPKALDFEISFLG